MLDRIGGQQVFDKARYGQAIAAGMVHLQNEIDLSWSLTYAQLDSGGYTHVEWREFRQGLGRRNVQPPDGGKSLRRGPYPPAFAPADNRGQKRVTRDRRGQGALQHRPVEPPGEAQP